MDTILLVDGNALLYRAYHAFPKELTTKEGQPIGAVYGFARILLTTVKNLKPTHVGVCFDLKGPTFRNAIFDQYKATREKMPEDLAGQIELTHQMVEYLEYPIYTAENYEADDVIGTIARQATDGKTERRVIIVSGDQDILQLVTDQVSVYVPASYPKVPVTYTPEKVAEKYGFAPLQMIEFKALRGDPSDNIPGVPGVGEVTATKLIELFGTIGNLYEQLKAGNTAEIKPAVLKKLTEHEASARMSHDLATIRTDVPVQFDFAACRTDLQHPERLVTMFERLGFKSLMKDLPISHKLLSEAADVFSGANPLPEEVAETRPDRPESESDRIDANLAPVLRGMEETGVKVDLPYLKDLENEYTAELEKMRATLNEWAGQDFNPDSPSQVGHILYEVLSIPTTWVRKGKTGYTTDAATLTELAATYPIAKLLLSYRELQKLQTTYAKPLQAITDESARIHTSYAPDTATGRLSSRNPNLQNIPARSEQGRRLRQAFVAEDGWTLVGADYSQMELRVAAHLSNDPVMREAFAQGSDFHAQTAERMNVDRRIAKIINFSILYGKGAFGFAQDLGITVAEAKKYIEQYFETYKGLRQYLDGILVQAKAQGYLETMFGRRRDFPNITSGSHLLRAAAEREAMNLPIQGSQADILKLAMCQLADRLKDEKARLILTVHDELVVETPNEDVPRIAAVLKETMINAVTLSVPIEVHVKIGTNWAEMEETELA